MSSTNKNNDNENHLTASIFTFQMSDGKSNLKYESIKINGEVNG